jgi:hypothetical protein
MWQNRGLSACGTEIKIDALPAVFIGNLEDLTKVSPIAGTIGIGKLESSPPDSYGCFIGRGA